MKSHSGEQVNSLGSCFPVKGMSYERTVKGMSYERTVNMFSRERNVIFLSYDIPFTGKHEPNELTCSPLCDFIAQLVRALHRHR